MSSLAALAARAVERSLPIAVAASVIVFATFFLSCGSGKLPPVGASNAYVTLPTMGAILTLHLDRANGSITLGVQTPQLVGTSPTGLVLSQSKKFLYVTNFQSNNISVFNVGSDGTLSLSLTSNPVTTESGPTTPVIDPTGKFLLVTNNASNNISVFSLDSTTGALTEVAGSPFYANFGPSQMVISPTGNYVYVSNPSIGAVSAFAFSPSTGALTPVGVPIFSGAGASALAINGTGQFLYVVNTSAINPGATTLGNISAFSINPNSGALSNVLGSPFTVGLGTAPGTVVINPVGSNFLFATTPGSSFSIWCFDINSQTGQLSQAPGSPFSLPAGGLFALIDTNGNYLYIGNQASKGIAAYTYDPNSCQPTVVSNSPFSTVSAPANMVIVN